MTSHRSTRFPAPVGIENAVILGRQPQLLTDRVPRARSAGVVDIENLMIVRGRLLREPQRQEVFRTLDSHLAGMPVRVASGPQVFKACLPELASRGWGRTLVQGEPDAADQALIEAGRHFAASGVSDLVVFSGDHVFAALASVARLHVFAYGPCLSRRLQLAATSITYLPVPHDQAETMRLWQSQTRPARDLSASCVHIGMREQG